MDEILLVKKEEELALQIAVAMSLNDIRREESKSLTTCDEKDVSRDTYRQKVTEYVPVPSSEHVAEIVGRQGRKIKALRAESNTFIRTPARDEEPVFVVVGRNENVAMARNVILNAAKHFTKVMEIRSNSEVSSIAASIRTPKNPSLMNTNTVSQDLSTPATITLKVRVPYKAVGFVVGPKGATLRTIEQQTHTRIIISDSKEDPVFQVTGLPENAENAKDEIRTLVEDEFGNHSCDTDGDIARNGIFVGTSPAYFSDFLSAFTSHETSDHQIDSQIGCSSCTAENQTSGLHVEENLSRVCSTSALRVCLMCMKKNVDAALIPCGHHRFCYQCATNAATSDAKCPCCKKKVVMAVKI